MRRIRSRAGDWTRGHGGRWKVLCRLCALNIKKGTKKGRGETGRDGGGFDHADKSLDFRQPDLSAANPCEEHECRLITGFKWRASELMKTFGFQLVSIGLKGPMLGPI